MSDSWEQVAGHKQVLVGLGKTVMSWAITVSRVGIEENSANVMGRNVCMGFLISLSICGGKREKG
jgi:hypothetical protein